MHFFPQYMFIMVATNKIGHNRKKEYKKTNTFVNANTNIH